MWSHNRQHEYPRKPFGIQSVIHSSTRTSIIMKEAINVSNYKQTVVDEYFCNKINMDYFTLCYMAQLMKVSISSIYSNTELIHIMWSKSRVMIGHVSGYLAMALQWKTKGEMLIDCILSLLSYHQVRKTRNCILILK